MMNLLFSRCVTVAAEFFAPINTQQEIKREKRERAEVTLELRIYRTQMQTILTTLVIGYYDYHQMIFLFACFISFQREKRVLGCERCFVHENARFSFVVSPVSPPPHRQFTQKWPYCLMTTYHHLVTCPEVVTISDNQCTALETL